MSKLTPRQKRFVEEYLIDLNATQAAIRAGYAKKSARQEGFRLLTNADIALAVQEAQERRSERTEISQDDVLKELAKLGFANAEDYFHWNEDGVSINPQEDLTREQCAAVSEVSQTTTEHGGTIRMKLHDKRAALVDIGRHLGMFKDKAENHVTLSMDESLKELYGELGNLTPDKLTDIYRAALAEPPKGSKLH